jgi:hypothetical protein
MDSNKKTDALVMLAANPFKREHSAIPNRMPSQQERSDRNDPDTKGLQPLVPNREHGHPRRTNV